MKTTTRSAIENRSKNFQRLRGPSLMALKEIKAPWDTRKSLHVNNLLKEEDKWSVFASEGGLQ